MNSLTEEERANLIKVYKELDENGDGKLARVELINAVRNYLDETKQTETETKRRQGYSETGSLVKNASFSFEHCGDRREGDR